MLFHLTSHSFFYFDFYPVFTMYRDLEHFLDGPLYKWFCNNNNNINIINHGHMDMVGPDVMILNLTLKLV